MLTACLMKTDILRLALVQPNQACADEDLLRVSMKLMVTIIFKSHKDNCRVLIGQPLNKLTSYQVELRKRLGPSFDETKDTQEQLNLFVEKIHAFELQHIHKGGYIQFIHLISQIVLQTTTPSISDDHRLRILPTRGIMTSLIESFCESMDGEHINSVANAIDGGPSAVAEHATKE